MNIFLGCKLSASFEIIVTRAGIPGAGLATLEDIGGWFFFFKVHERNKTEKSMIAADRSMNFLFKFIWG
jgi:hypothetical protein